MISAADAHVVGWPLPASLVDRTESMRSRVATFLRAATRDDACTGTKDDLRKDAAQSSRARKAGISNERCKFCPCPAYRLKWQHWGKSPTIVSRSENLGDNPKNGGTSRGNDWMHTGRMGSDVHLWQTLRLRLPLLIALLIAAVPPLQHDGE